MERPLTRWMVQIKEDMQAKGIDWRSRIVRNGKGRPAELEKLKEDDK